MPHKYMYTEGAFRNALTDHVSMVTYINHIKATVAAK